MAYVSCITINGRPILPPLMTQERIVEMQRYRNMAREIEEKIRKSQIDSNLSVSSGCLTFRVEENSNMDNEKMCLEDQNHHDLTDITQTMNGLNILEDKSSTSDCNSPSESPVSVLISTQTQNDDPQTSALELETDKNKTDLWSIWDEDFVDNIIPSPSAITVEGVGKNDVDISPISPISINHQSKSEIDSSPSLASTDLSKYMDTSPEDVFIDSPRTDLKFKKDENVENMKNSTQNRTESSSTCSTVKASSQFTPENAEMKINSSLQRVGTSLSLDSPQELNKKHVRRSSYTLECPSPALVAQVHFYEDQGLEFPSDMSKIRRESFGDVEKNKQEQMEKYLENVIDENKHGGDEEARSLTPVKSSCEGYFEMMKMKLEEEHKVQMEMLLKKQKEEREKFEREMLTVELKERILRKRREVDGKVEEFNGDLAVRSELRDKVWKKKPNFERLSAFVKGYLTRRLLKTERVQDIIKTIRDTLEFALNFHDETPVKTGRVTPVEANLHQRILQQLTSSCHEFHDVFFNLPIAEQMSFIAQDRALQQEKLEREKASENALKRNLSSATLKALERKRVKLQNNSNKKMSSKERSKSALPWSLPKRKSSKQSESSRLSSPLKSSFRPRTTSPRFHTRLLSRSALASERINRNPRRNLSAAYPPPDTKNSQQNGGRTFRVNRLSPRSVHTFRANKNQ